MLSKAISIAARTFEGVKDRGGKPYILHCMRVMLWLNSDDEELNSIAILHDVPEDDGRDPEIVINELKAAGFSSRVINALRLLTHRKEIPYDDYIKAIPINDDARRVKLSDLKDNSDITRLKGLTKKDFDRLEKYSRSFVYLSKI